MSRRGESIYKRKDGRWEARYIKEIGTDGKKKYASVYADSYREVKAKRQLLIISANQKIATDVIIKISDLTTIWLRHIKQRVKPATYQKYESICRNHINNDLGNALLTNITRASIDTFAENKLLSNEKLSVKTVNDILIVLGLIFKFAEEEYKTQMPRISFIREEKKEARVLSNEEQNQLIEYLIKDIDIYKFGALFTLFTGIRIGELCALKWEDITENSVTINKTMQRLKDEKGGTQIVIGSPKSESSKRVIPLPTPILPYIKQFRKPSGYVLSTNKHIHSEPRIMQQKFEKITNKCNLQNVTFHTLRHTFATRCIEAGFDVKTLSEILGHTDIKTTLNRYVHSSFELKQLNMEKLCFTNQL